MTRRMQLIVTVPSPHQTDLLRCMARKTDQIDAIRFNTAERSPFSPQETLERLRDRFPTHPLWVDLKGRQLRVTQWGEPGYGDIVLNREISVMLPAQLMLRSGEEVEIRAICEGRKLYVEPTPKYAVGAGQAVNVFGQGLEIHGPYLTELDYAYLEAAKALGIDTFMLSFVESSEDVRVVRELFPESRLALKIESWRGIDFLDEVASQLDERTCLMAARDDLSQTSPKDPTELLSVCERIVRIDPRAILASRVFSSLARQTVSDPADFADLRLMQLMGYQTICLSDGISQRAFSPAMDAWWAFQARYG